MNPLLISKLSVEELNTFFNKVDSMLEDAYNMSIEDSEVKVKEIKFERQLINAGDYALEFEVFFYIESLPNTKVTKTARQYTSFTPNKINEYIYIASVINGLDLSTPQIINLNKGF